MKMRIILFSIYFLFATTSPMDPPFKNRWIQMAGGILVGTVALRAFLSYIHSSQPQKPLSQQQPLPETQEPFDFSQLPKDMRLIIIDLLTRNAYAQTLEEAAYTINSLAQVNKELNELLNDSRYCLQIIKHLSQRFNCSDEAAAKALKIKAAKERLELQAFLNLIHIRNDILPDEMILDALIQDGIDLDFTFTSYEGEVVVTPLTPLIVCIAYGRFELATLLIQKGANINNSKNIWGVTPLMQCTSNMYYEHRFDFFKYLMSLPNINVNQKDIRGQTAFNRFLIAKFWQAGGESITLEQTLEVIKLLLDAGADPENPMEGGIAPLEVIRRNHFNVIPDQASLQKIIAMMEDAIQRKHAKKQ